MPKKRSRNGGLYTYTYLDLGTPPLRLGLESPLLAAETAGSSRSCRLSWMRETVRVPQLKRYAIVRYRVVSNPLREKRKDLNLLVLSQPRPGPTFSHLRFSRLRFLR